MNQQKKRGQRGPDIGTRKKREFNPGRKPVPQAEKCKNFTVSLYPWEADVLKKIYGSLSGGLRTLITKPRREFLGHNPDTPSEDF